MVKQVGLTSAVIGDIKLMTHTGSTASSWPRLPLTSTMVLLLPPFSIAFITMQLTRY